MNNKECARCNKIKNVSEFHKHAKRYDGYQQWCKSCRSITTKTTYKNKIRTSNIARRQANKDKYEDVFYEEMLRSKEDQTKRCFLCEQQLTYKNFGIDRTRLDGFQNKCRQCKSEMDKQHHSKPEVKKRALDQLRKRRNEMPAGIYIIKNIETNKVYVGQSKILHKRFNDHRINFKNKTHENPRIVEDIIHWGANSFEFEVIEELPGDIDRKILLEKEAKLIQKYINEGTELYNKEGVNQ